MNDFFNSVSTHNNQFIEITQNKEEMTMDTVEQILNSIGLKVSDMHSLDQTDSLIVSRIFDSVKHYAMYHDKNPELEAQCERFEIVLRQHINQNVIK